MIINVFGPESFGFGCLECVRHKPEFDMSNTTCNQPWVHVFKNSTAFVERDKMTVRPANTTFHISHTRPNKMTITRSIERGVWLSDNSYNYVHFLNSIVPRIALLKKADKFDNAIFIVEENSGYRKDFLEDIIGIPHNQIVVLMENMVFECGEFIITSRPVDLPFGYPSWAINYMRSLFPEELNNSKRDKKIYVSRHDSNRRRVNNEQEVITALTEQGFETVWLEGMHVRDQVRLFNQAEIIVTPHGAALGNLLWCEAGTKIVEIFNDAYINAMYYALARRMQLDYRVMFDVNPIFAIPGEDRIPFEIAQSLNIDVNVPELLEKIK